MEPTVSAEFEKLINNALATLTDVVPVRSSFSHSGATKRSLDAALLSQAARRHGLDVLSLSEQLQVLSDGRKLTGFYQNMSWKLTALDRFITNDKELTKRVLSEAGLPVARGEVVSSVEAAVEVYRRLAGPAVVKPVVGSNGKGITVGVVDEAELVEAVGEALVKSSRVLVEECISSIDLRIMVVAGQAVAAMMRVPANVLGDGVSTIRQLVDKKNEHRAANAFHKFVPITVTKQTSDQLASHGLTLDSVLEPGRRVFLHYKANLSSGGDSVNITDRIHPDFMRLAERAMKCFPSADHGGVDILAERIDLAPEAQQCVICEINCNNDLPIHVFPLFGASIDAATLEINAHFPPVPRLRRLRRAAIGRGGIAHHQRRPQWRSGQSRAAQRTYAADLGAWAGAHQLLANPVTGVNECPGDSPRRLDHHFLAKALVAADGAEVTVAGRLLLADHGDHEIVLERSGRSVFTGVLANRPDMLYQLFKAAELPACAARLFEPDELARAKSFLRAHPGPWDLRLGGRKRQTMLRHSFQSENALAAGWAKAADSTIPILLQQTASRLALSLLLIEARVAACLLQVPFGVTGDGTSTVQELLEAKASTRVSHPYFRHLPVKAFLVGEANLARHKLTPTTVPPAGSRVELGRSPLPALGGESIGLDSCPVPGLSELAMAAHGLVGSPPVVSITFAARHRDGDAPWALASVDPDPVIAPFAWPWCGAAPGESLYQTIAQVVRSGPRYRLSRNL